MTVGLTGYGIYRPDERISAGEIAAESGIPEDVVRNKMGIEEKRVCPDGADHVTDMCLTAAERALDDAGVAPAELDLLLYHGSEYKDYIVWSAAADIAHRLGAESAAATENHTLCASAPVSIQRTKAQLAVGQIDTALHVSASREEDIVEYSDTDASFMFNFGSAGSAYVLEADPGPKRNRASVRASDTISDGSFAEDVVMPAGGSRNPPSRETVAAGQHTVTVQAPEDMGERMASVSEENFMSVADAALTASGYERTDVDFLALTHMKRSFSESLCENFGLDLTTESYYLSEYGHVQSTDQLLALDEGHRAGRLDAGDVVLFLAAGTGYTWAATVLEWHG